MKNTLLLIPLLTAAYWATAQPDTTTKQKQHPIDTKGAWVSLDATQLVQTGVVATYERQFLKRASFWGTIGVKRHNISPTGSLVYDYQESYQNYFLFTGKHTSQPSKPKNLGDFLPIYSTELSAGMRFYTKNAAKSNFFVQPSIGMFVHSGFKVEDKRTLLSRETFDGSTSADTWLGLGDAKVKEQWHLERKITEREIMTNLHLALSIGYRIVLFKKANIDLGISCFGNFNGNKSNIQYYGIQDVFARGFIGIGWKIQ